jgi:hypothetical protein
VLVPHGSFRTPLASVLPSALLASDDGSGGAIIRLSQVQDVLGYSAPRPAAPFVYTNAWGNALSLALVWLVVRYGCGGGRRGRLFTVLFCLVALVPIIYSLNRGLWIGLVLSVVYVVVRLALRGRLGLVIGSGLAVAALGAVVVFSPLGTTIQGRLDNGHSNQIREVLAAGALTAVKASPVLGYGSTRSTQGSGSSIAVGKSPDCPKCGNRNIGSTGQLWMLLISQGLVGTALYYLFFIKVLWTYRHDASPIGIGGTLAILLSIFYSLFYTALLIPLSLTMLSVAMLWRNARVRASAGTSDGTQVLSLSGAAR